MAQDQELLPTGSNSNLDERTREEIREDVRRGIIAALKDLGVDTADWREVQKDFTYLRAQRMARDELGKAARRGVVLAAIGTVASGALVLAWEIVKFATKLKAGN